MAEYYSLRRLSPYLGVIQVIDVGTTCAYSTNGRNWQLRTINAYGRFRLTGLWSDYETAAPQSVGDIGSALRERPPIPYPPGDHFELWLLRRETLRPLALLKTRRWRHEIGVVEDPAWRPFLLEDNAFHSRTLAGTLPAPRPATRPPAHRDHLERLVNGAARPLPIAQWFERHADGGAMGLSGLRVTPEIEGRVLAQEAFPELLVDELHWPDARDGGLVADYHDWNAARLLAHHGLSRETRARLERAACQTPEKLLDCYPMIPEIVDRDAMRVALVTAQLIRAG
jgi:hypothetical protein